MLSKENLTGSLYHGVGRRKEAVARVWLRPGGEQITINGKKMDEYFPTSTCTNKVLSPLKLTNYEGKMGILVNVDGGGFNGQADAAKLGISRALTLFDAECRPVLKKQGLLRVDARIKERKKFGQKGARKKFQFVKR